MEFPHLTQLMAHLALAPEAAGQAGESVPWDEVADMIKMVEEALRVRAETVTALRGELDATRGTYEVEFLENQIQTLNEERNSLQHRVQDLTRDKQNLEQQVAIMRAAEAAATAAEAAGPSPLAPLAAELTAERTGLHNDLRSLKSKLDSIREHASSAATSPHISSTARRSSMGSQDSVGTP